MAYTRTLPGSITATANEFSTGAANSASAAVSVLLHSDRLWAGNWTGLDTVKSFTARHSTAIPRPKAKCLILSLYREGGLLAQQT